MSDPKPAGDPAAAPHDWRPGRFMVIAAHPDDAEFGPSGTAAAWIAAGSTGWLVCCTSGDQGGEDPDADPLELAALRETEQRAACAVIGYEGVTFLHQPDGALANDLALREMLVREIRTFQPDAVLATDPEAHLPFGWRASTTPTIARPGWRPSTRSIPAARNPMAFPSLARGGLAAHKVRRLYLFWSNRPNAWVDITADARSQDRGAGRARQPDPRARAAGASGSASWAAEEGAPIGVAAAEALRVIVIDDDEDEGPG